MPTDKATQFLSKHPEFGTCIQSHLFDRHGNIYFVMFMLIYVPAEYKHCLFLRYYFLAGRRYMLKHPFGGRGILPINGLTLALDEITMSTIVQSVMSDGFIDPIKKKTNFRFIPSTQGI